MSTNEIQELVPRYGIENEWFDGKSVHVARPDAVARFFGRVPLPIELSLLAGMFKGAKGSCSYTGLDVVGTNARGLRFEVRHNDWIHPGHSNEVWLYRTAGGHLELRIESVFLSPAAPRGLATLVLWRMVRACVALDIRRITLFAIGGRSRDLAGERFRDGSRWGGYYYWPSVGFDGQIDDADRQFIDANYRFPQEIEKQPNVRGIFDLEGGKGAHFWRYNGNDVEDCEFLMDGNKMTLSVAILSAKVQSLVAEV